MLFSITDNSTIETNIRNLNEQQKRPLCFRSYDSVYQALFVSLILGFYFSTTGRFWLLLMNWQYMHF
jgi:hypothetical protein